MGRLIELRQGGKPTPESGRGVSEAELAILTGDGQRENGKKGGAARKKGGRLRQKKGE